MPTSPPPGAKNVLWFIVDDLRPQLNASYGQTQMRTPATDRLARQGVVLAYAR